MPDWGKVGQGLASVGAMGAGAISGNVPLFMGGLAAGSGLLTNQSNAAQAQAQMDFQERMSSTSAQRGQADYTAAGLNPALAYDRGASTPGGASATMTDPAAAGAASASAAQQLLLAKETARRATIAADYAEPEIRANIAKTQQETAAAAATTAMAEAETRTKMNDLEFKQTISQPATRTSLALDNLLKQLAVPNARLRGGAADLLQLPLKGWQGIANGSAANGLLDALKAAFQPRDEPVISKIDGKPIKLNGKHK
jgi:hypothetical protein